MGDMEPMASADTLSAPASARREMNVFGKILGKLHFAFPLLEKLSHETDRVVQRP